MGNKIIETLWDTGKRIGGEFTPPPDKSITHRAIILASLSPKKSIIKNPLLSGDCLSTLNAFRKLGVPIEQKSNELVISEGKRSSFSPLRELKPPITPIDCENSGTTMRLLAGVLAAQNFESELIGDSSLSKRPMCRVIEPLRKMGATISARDDNYAPLKIKGNPHLQPIAWKSPVASAQIKSSILLAGLFANGKTEVEEPGKSRNHTELMLKGLGAKVDCKIGTRSESSIGTNIVTIECPSELEGINYEIPRDFSSAAFFMALAVLVPNSSLIIKAVCYNPTRVGLLRVLHRMTEHTFHVSPYDLLNPFHEPSVNIDVVSTKLKGIQIMPYEIPYMIDEIPILAVLATQAMGKTVISGAEELRVKESDRIHSIVTELTKMGAKITEKKDGMVIEGPTPLIGTKVQSYGDHRMAMSLAVAASIAQGETEIEDFDCARISFPGFLAALKGLVK